MLRTSELFTSTLGVIRKRITCYSFVMSIEIELAPRHDVQIVNTRDKELTESTIKRIKRSVPKNTSRVYKKQYERYEQWCQEEGRTALPGTAQTLASFATYLADTGLSDSSIQQAIGSILRMHRLHDLEAPKTSLAHQVLRDHRREQSSEGKKKREAPPITRKTLSKLLATCPNDTLTGLRDRVALIFGYSLAARRAELANLNMEDIQVGERALMVLIRESKTDKQSEGVTVSIPYGNDNEFSPYKLLMAWKEALKAAGQDSEHGRLVRSITKDGRLRPKASVHPDTINQIVKRAALKAGLPNPSLYSAHSLRAGFATNAAQERLPMGIWARHGRWKPTSPIPASYVRREDEITDNPLNIIGF